MLEALDQARVRLAWALAWHVRPALLMLGAAGALMRVGKNFLAQTLSLHRRSRT